VSDFEQTIAQRLVLFEFMTTKPDRDVPTMMAGNKWTELLTCPNCKASGLVHLSQPEGRGYDFNAEVVPAGFRVVCTNMAKSFLVALATGMRSAATQVHCNLPVTGVAIRGKPARPRPI
jgi:hypothetical protein